MSLLCFVSLMMTLEGVLQRFGIAIAIGLDDLGGTLCVVPFTVIFQPAYHPRWIPETYSASALRILDVRPAETGLFYGKPWEVLVEWRGVWEDTWEPYSALEHTPCFQAYFVSLIH